MSQGSQPDPSSNDSDVFVAANSSPVPSNRPPQMSPEIQSDHSSNHSDEHEPQAASNPVPSNPPRPLNMSEEIQSVPSNHPHEHESQDISNPVEEYRRFLLEARAAREAKEREEIRKNREIDLPLYEASLRCDWKAAEAILDENPDMELVRCKITENGDTALHIAASAKAPKEKVDEFVKNLVERMTPEDLELENNNKSTALYLAAVAGNIETVKIMIEKNREPVQKNWESMKKNWESMQKNRESMQKNEESMQKNHESMQKNEESMEKNQESMQKNRESMQKNEESMQKNRESMKKNEESMQKNEESMQKNEELMQKNEELMEKNRESWSMRKNEESMQMNQESMQKNQESMQKNQESMKKNEESMQKNEESMQKNEEAIEKNRELTEKNRELTETNRELTETIRELTETNLELAKKNRYLDTIPGGGGDMMPLYAAVLFGNKDVAEYLYECSQDLSYERGWYTASIELLLEKCVESDMFDIAIQIVKKYSWHGRTFHILRLLARKPEAFHEKKSSNTESNIIKRTIKSVKKYPYLGRRSNLLGFLARKPDAFHEKKSSNTESDEAFHEKKFSNTESDEAFHEKKSSNKESDMIRRTFKSVSAFFGNKAETPVKKGDALSLLRILWGDILKKPNSDIDDILRGRPDWITSGSGRIVQSIQLEKLIISHLDKLVEEIETIMKGTEKVSKLKDLVSEYVVDMHSKTQSLIKKENTTDECQALELQKLISEFIVKLHHETKKMFAIGYLSDEEQARRLQNLISDHIKKIRAETEIKMHAETHSSRVMFIAAEVGNTNFLLELIRRRPDLIWQVDDNGLSIFHVAVKHRHEGIYNLLYEIGSMKDMVTPLKDNDGNNMLHLAAMSTKKKNLEDVSGAALRMQRELLWFEEVERMIPPSSRVSKNKDGFTPRELFTMEHQDLIDQGEKWMKETASQCMVVAALIATIVFAAAFTVPGGYDQNDGIPMFKQNLSFVAFVVADAISLFLSSASILTFLSILTSRYAERDFVASLPMKLMLGLVTLFLSIGTMMITFSVSFFVLYHREMKWIPIFISLFAITPAILYVALQFHLLVDVFRSTYGGKYLFKPENQVLFYENPKV